MKTQYVKAVNSLKSSVNWSKLESEMEEYQALCHKQRNKLKRILDSGLDPVKVYHDLCTLRHEGEEEADRVLRVCAMGAARFGYKKYFERYE
jgi:ferritin-like metal-binding protein YciE